MTNLKEEIKKIIRDYAVSPKKWEEQTNARLESLFLKTMEEVIIPERSARHLGWNAARKKMLAKLAQLKERK